MTHKRQKPWSFEVELLEPRLYLSVGARLGSKAAMPSFHAAVLFGDRLLAAPANSLADLQMMAASDPGLSVVVVDVNGIDNPNDALIATFDPETGRLIGSIAVSGGQIVLIESPHAQTNHPGSSGTASNGSATGAGNPNSTPAGDALTDPPQSKTPSGGDQMPSHPVVIVFPDGHIPPSFGVDSAAVVPSGSDRSKEAVIILPHGFPQWLGAFNSSPWWTRVGELPGVQARVTDLLSSGIDDSTPGLRGRLHSDDAAGGLGQGGSSFRSRVWMRSPGDVMVFTTPRAGFVGDASAELAVYDLTTGETKRPGYPVHSRLFRTGNQIAFLSPGGDPESDMAGDGSVDALTLQLFNPINGSLKNTGIRAEVLRSEGGQLIVGIRGAGPAADARRDSDGRFAYRFDPATGRIVDLQRAFDPDPVRVPSFPRDGYVGASPPVPPPLLDRFESLDGLRPRFHSAAPLDRAESNAAPEFVGNAGRATSGVPTGPPKPGGSDGTAPASAPSSAAASPSSASGGGSSGSAGGGE